MIAEFEFGGARWYVVSYAFPTPALARAAWEAIDERGKRKHLDVGLYRHGPEADPGRFLTAVTHVRESALAVKRECRSGVPALIPEELSEPEVEAFIRRRIAVLAEREFRPGFVRIRHPGEGARLYPDGTMEEPTSGRG